MRSLVYTPVVKGADATPARVDYGTPLASTTHGRSFVPSRHDLKTRSTPRMDRLSPRATPATPAGAKLEPTRRRAPVVSFAADVRQFSPATPMSSVAARQATPFRRSLSPSTHAGGVGASSGSAQEEEEEEAPVPRTLMVQRHSPPRL